MISVEEVAFEIAGRPVIQDLSLSVRRGERVVLLGVNGCGKTTLLKLLDGLAFPTRGNIRYDGERLDARALDGAAFRRRFRSEVALVFQNVDAMLFNPTVADEIAFGPRQLGASEADVNVRVKAWARQFELEGLLERPPFELSGGEKKRVALASVFAVGPKLLLLDEVTANLDPASSARLVDFLLKLDDMTIVASTHNLTVAEELGARAILLAPGHAGVLFDGPTGDLLANDSLLVESGLAHRHVHRHRAAAHVHYHVHDSE